MYMFVDRDMMMRFRGGGIGHKSTHEATNTFLSDRHRSDMTSSGTANTTSEMVGPMEDDNELDEENNKLGLQLHAQEETLTDEEEDYVYKNPMHQQLQESDSNESRNNSDDGFEDGSDNGLDDGLGPEDGEDDAEDEGDWGYAEL
ncbi:hypothetical protein C0992_011764 [Termitomyces sp. T32_za158]|nr:hypothetical protein C0992_011764 [Termitomyces sp. T32_za158]